MALSRYNATSGLLTTNYQGKENIEGIRGKSGFAKPRQPLQDALANISNATKANGKAEQKKGLKEALKPTRVPVKSAVDKTRSKTSNPPVEAKENEDSTQVASIPSEEAPVCVPSYSQKLMHSVQDIDRHDGDNPQLVSSYVNDIYDYLRELELRFPIKYDHLKDNSEINVRMRGILVDWLVQVHLRFRLLQETLFQAIAIIDRFLQVQTVSRKKLQLIGVTAMLIASKYEEMFAPEIGDFVYITDNAYTKTEIRKAECTILRTLDFSLGRPLPLHFLRRNSKAGEVDSSQHVLAKYFMELTLVDYELTSIRPSELAAAALCLSIKVLQEGSWSETLQHYSKYSEEDLRPVMQRIALLVTKAGTGKNIAIKSKYQSSKFMKISLIPELSSDLITEYATAASNNRSSNTCD